MYLIGQRSIDYACCINFDPDRECGLRTVIHRGVSCLRALLEAVHILQDPALVFELSFFFRLKRGALPVDSATRLWTIVPER